jgi:hypothetical protein
MAATDEAVLRQAAEIERGQMDLPDGETRRVHTSFDADDYAGASPGGDLAMASLVVPETLLRAYEINGNETAFGQARNIILGFHEFESGLLTDFRLVRNDHAIAARVGVLVHFWRLYRHRPDFDAGVARAVMQHAARCAAYLSKRSHFTAATNHGVMQNIALLQAAAAFPSLPDAATWRDTARARLSRQMAFFVNGEGVVLEHSPGYHRFGTELMGMIVELLEWNQMPAIDGLAGRSACAAAFLVQLERPDGSIPRIGDTSGIAAERADSGRRPRSACDKPDGPLGLPDTTKVYPSAGYAITRRPLVAGPGGVSGTSHATLYWSRFPGHGHEVGAEGSFVLWAAGTDWLDNTGYWPYGLRGELDARGWRGSNAPHLVGESAHDQRTSTLVAVGADLDSHLLDVERKLTGGARIKRQVVQIDAMTWLVLDSWSAPTDQSMDRLWTLAPGLTISDLGEARRLTARDPATGWSLQMEFLSAGPLEVRALRGSLEPFGGWVVNGPRPMPSTAYQVRQPPGTVWTALLLALSPPGTEPKVMLPALDYASGNEWTLKTGSGVNSTLLQRRGSRLLVSRHGASTKTLELVPPAPELLADHEAIARALTDMTREFRRFNPYFPYRVRLTSAVAAGGLATLLAWIWLRHRASSLRRIALSLTLACWSMLAAWIHLVYLAG